MLSLLVAGLSALTGLVLAVLIWRARKPLMLPALAVAAIKFRQERLPLWWRALRKPWDYLAAQHELRYRSAWILLIGQQGAGKSSLLASIDPSLWQTPSAQQKKLVMAGSSWRFLAQGALIDPHGELPAAVAGSKPAQAWRQLLAQLDDLRPERPIDGVMLVLSARSLQTDSASERLALAESLRAQLALLERLYEFALPVYVVITEMDSINGCNAFWHTQTSVRPHEIMGWSMPERVSADAPGTWVDTAFDSLGEQLRRLQVQAAAGHQHVDPEQTDQFFLFPRHFLQLREPLRQCMNIVFQSSSWQNGGFCRGLYFTGAIEAPTADGAGAAPTGLPRQDIAFVDDLISKKIFAEPYLARPSRHGVWSRNKTIRRIQVASLSVLAVLLVSLAWAGIQLQRQATAMRSGLVALQKIEQQVAVRTLPAGSCIDKDTVFLTVEQIAQFQNNTTYWAIPASWVDHQLSNESVLPIANGAFKNVVLAGIACQLEQQAQSLMTAPAMSAPDNDKLAHLQVQQALLSYGQNLSRLQANLARFKQIGGAAQGRNTLASFIALCNDAYRAVLPASVMQDQGVLGAALRQAQYGQPLKLPDDMKDQQARQLADAAGQLASQVGNDVGRGDSLLGQLEQDSGPILPKTRLFTAWLQWVSGSWSGATPDNNPCKTLENQLQAQADVLHQYEYPPLALKTMVGYFSTAKCYQPNMRKLTATQIAPYGPLFLRSSGAADKTLTLNPLLVNELAGLKALLPQGFMQVQNLQPFSCQSKVAGWRASDIGLANRYVTDYDQFLSSLAVAPAGASTAGAAQRPLYQRVALRQLELALNSNLNHAQIAAAPNLVAVDAAASDDQALAQESSSFSGLLEPLLALQRSYHSKDFAASETQLKQCISNYSSDSLARVQNLSDISRLYEAAGSTGSGTMFDLGTTPVIKDFLDRQQARAQVLSAYASPYLSYLNNSAGQNSAHLNNTQSASYWSKTVTELNNYVQFKEPSGQVALLNTLFLKQLPSLTAGNCSDQIAAYQPAPDGNDLFSARRLKLLSQAQANCQGERNAQASNSYSALANRFNRELAGRYPFGPLSGADANLVTVRNFFADYTAQSAALRQSLQGLSGAYWTSARQFLAQLDSSAKFFQGTLNLTPAAPPAAATAPASAALAAPADSADNAGVASLPVRLGVQFHAQANNSPGSDQLVGWSLSSGSKSAAFPNRSTTLDWDYGQALILDLTWASGSQWLPAADLQQTDLQTSGVGASFAASGDWALLRLIEKHQPNNGVLPNGSDPNKLLLEFLVPVISNGGKPGKTAGATAKLYLGLNLSGTDPKTHAPVSLKLPLGLPRSAP